MAINPHSVHKLVSKRIGIKREIDFLEIMASKLVSVNIQGKKNLDKIIRFIEQEQPHIITMQEIFEVDFENFAREFNMDGLFVPMDQYYLMRVPGYGTGVKGISILTSLSFDNTESKCYAGSGNAPIITNPESTEGMIALLTAYENEIPLRIGTTHFTYSPNGTATDLQRRNFRRLISELKEENDLALAGDFNVPRGREIFNLFLQYFKDNIPKDIDSTLDPILHSAPHLRYVVDTIFTRGSMVVTGVQTHQGIRDHKGLSGMVSNSAYSR